MDLHRIQEDIERTVAQGVSLHWLSYPLVLAAGFLGAFVGSYVKKKGENLATKEDVGGITTEIEAIKSTFEKELQADRQRHELSIAALDKRLEAHQDAYVLWWELLHHVHDRERNGQTVMKCQDWFIANSLYLTPDARVAFSEAYHAAWSHPDLLETPVTERARMAPQVEENMRKIKIAGETIVRAVALPPWKEAEPLPPSISRPEPS